MGGISFGKVITLGPLYNIDKFKGRIHWLILILFKLLLPLLLVLLFERSEADSYRWKMVNFYKRSMSEQCEAYKRIPLQEDRYSIPWFDDDLKPNEKEDKLSLSVSDAQNSLKQLNKVSSQMDKDRAQNEQLKKALKKLLEIKEKYPTDVDKNLYYKSETCCKRFRTLVEKQTTCLKKQGINTSEWTYVLALFCPLIGSMVVGIITAPIKWSRLLQSKLLMRGSHPRSGLTAEELIKDIQGGVQMAVDVVVYYFVVAKFCGLSKALQECCETDDCLPPYSSNQVNHVLYAAQTPWLSILWGFIYT